jgi:hypothetical protein
VKQGIVEGKQMKRREFMLTLMVALIGGIMGGVLSNRLSGKMAFAQKETVEEHGVIKARSIMTEEIRISDEAGRELVVMGSDQGSGRLFIGGHEPHVEVIGPKGHIAVKLSSFSNLHLGWDPQIGRLGIRLEDGNSLWQVPYPITP